MEVSHARSHVIVSLTRPRTRSNRGVTYDESLDESSDSSQNGKLKRGNTLRRDPDSLRRGITTEEVKHVQELPDLMDRISQMGLTDEYISFRERYLGWRQGEATGAAGELTKKTGWGFWYPNLQVWQWRRSLSYWISVTFFEGSIFFTISSFLWCYGESFGYLKETVTIYGYIAGKVNFLICTYMMCLETINLSNADEMEGPKEKKNNSAERTPKRGTPNSSERPFGSDHSPIKSKGAGRFASARLPDLEDATASSSDESTGSSEDGTTEETWLWWPFHIRTAIRKLDRLGAGPWPYYASAIYLLGVLTFTVGLVADFCPIPHEVAEMIGNISFLFGSLFFTIGGAAECVENEVFVSLKCDQGWVGALLNFLGGLGFLVGAILAFIEGMSYWSLFMYGIGSAIFTFGSAVMIIMWKDEQFGLTFLAVLNQLGGHDGRPLIGDSKSKDKDNEEKTLSAAAAVFIMVYVMVGVMSTYDFLIVIEKLSVTEMPLVVAQEAFTAGLPCIFAHFMLALTSGVYRTPSVAPFKQLYIGCRYLGVLMCINNTLRFVRGLQRAYCVTRGECEAWEKWN